MDASVYDELLVIARTQGKENALERLENRLRADEDWHRLFDALTLRARHDVGLPLILPSHATIDADVRRRYEDRLIEACRQIGTTLLSKGDVQAAHHYLGMIGEMEPLIDWINSYRAVGDERDDAAIDVALYRGVVVEKGLALAIGRHGLCQSITACEGILSQETRPTVRDACLTTLVKALHSELVARVKADIEQVEGQRIEIDCLSAMLEGRDHLFADGNYHIDTSHLNAVVRLARWLPAGSAAALAAELCDYGRRLADMYRFAEPPPFENLFEDGWTYFNALAGKDVDAGVTLFRQKAADQTIDEIGSMPSEVYLHLLVQLGRLDEAVDFAKAWLPESIPGSPWRPTFNELCQRAGRFDEMAEQARRRDDPASFLAGVLQQPIAVVNQ